MTILVVTLVATLFVSALCSILEAVLLSIDLSFVEVLRSRGRRSGLFLHRLKSDIDRPIAAILTLNTIAHTAGAAITGALVLDIFGSRWVAVFSGLLTLAILILSEIIPKTVGARFCKELAPPAAYVLRVLVVVMTPVLVPLSWVQRLVQGSGKKTPISRAEIEVMAQMGLVAGALDEDEWQVVTNVMRLDEVPVGEVMTPRTDMVAVPIDASVEDAKGIMLDHGHLRLPAYDETLDKIGGILLARDLWHADREGVTEIRDLLRPVQFAPASKPVEDLIPELREQRAKMVIVLDEFGGTAGLATLEDLIEEIIGEIQDEHEEHEPLDFQALPEGATRLWGAVPLREVNERLHLELPVDQFDTIGGFLFGTLRRIPKAGDEVAVDGGGFRVVRMRGRRVEFIVFKPARTSG